MFLRLQSYRENTQLFSQTATMPFMHAIYALSLSLDNKNTKPHQSSLAHLLPKLPVKAETICENVTKKTPPVWKGTLSPLSQFPCHGIVPLNPLLLFQKTTTKNKHSQINAHSNACFVTQSPLLWTRTPNRRLHTRTRPPSILAPTTTRTQTKLNLLLLG